MINIILGIITYNRLNYLKKALTTFLETFNTNYNYQLIIADDGSTDGTIEFIENWIKTSNIKTILIKNNRKFINGQTNSILHKSLEFDYDFGFMINDDLEFISVNWDTNYVLAMNNSNYKHLVFYDVNFASSVSRKYNKTYKQKYIKIINSDINIKLISKTTFKYCLGCFWTFNKDIINTVGYFNTINFIGSGYSHLEYTLRCCRAGYNDLNNLFDVENPNIIVNCEKNDLNYKSVKDNLNIKNNRKAFKNTINNLNIIYTSL